MILYCKGDCHSSNGYKKFYKHYLENRDKNSYFIFLGDLIDPEPPFLTLEQIKANPVVDDGYRLMSMFGNILGDVGRLLSSDKNTYCVLGNHELMRIFVPRLNEAEIRSLTSRFFNRKWNDFMSYKESNKKLYNKWMRMYDKITNFIDSNSRKIKMAIEFDKVILSHNGVNQSYLNNWLNLGKITTEKLVKNYKILMSSYTQDKDSVLNNLPGYTQIVGHYAGIKEYPTIVKSGNSITYMIDDSVLKRGSSRGFIFNTEDGTYKIFE